MGRFTPATWLLSAAALLVPPSVLGAGGPWIKAATHHFELYTQQDAGHATQAMEVLEQAREFFLETGFAPSLAGRPVKILDLASETEYKPLLVKPGAYACYQHGHRADYIVLSDLDPAHYEVAVHEFTHYVMQQAGWKLPIWMNEGLADFYATLEPQGNRWLVGRAEPGRLEVLATERRFPLEALFSVDGDSPYYNDPRKMPMFYAESWALIHMLAASAPYSERFRAFVSAIVAGRSEAEAFQLAWGKTVSDIQASLDSYLRQNRMNGLLYDRQPWRDENVPVVSALSANDLDLSIADLLASNPYIAPGTEPLIAQLSRRHSGEPGFEELLGYLALRERRTQLAETHFANAVERQSEDPMAIYNSARLQQASGAPAQTVLPLLERALALNPDYAPARIDLGFTAAKADRFELAAATLSQLKPIDPNMAFEVYFTIAYCHLKLQRFDTASNYASLAAQHARNSSQQQKAAALLRVIGSREVASAR